MGNSGSKGKLEVTTANDVNGVNEVNIGWRNKLSPRAWHHRFTPQGGIVENGGRRLGDRITQSDVQSINDRGGKAIEAANDFTFMHNDIIISYKRAKKKNQVSQDLIDYELPGDVKLTNFVDTYITVEKMMKRANSRLGRRMTVQQLNEFNLVCEQLEDFNEKLKQGHDSNSQLQGAVYNMLRPAYSQMARRPEDDGLKRIDPQNGPQFVINENDRL